MKKVFFTIFSILFIAGQPCSAINFYPEKRAAAYIKKTLKTKEIDNLHGVSVKDDLLSENATIIYAFNLPFENDLYYAIFTEARGRHEKFDYLVITNSEKEIVKVKVLKYRSEHGGEIASKKWLSQFENYSGGPLKYGKDISAISGATVSAKAITSDIPRAVKILAESLN